MNNELQNRLEKLKKQDLETFDKWLPDLNIRFLGDDKILLDYKGEVKTFKYKFDGVFMNYIVEKKERITALKFMFDLAIHFDFNFLGGRNGYN